LSVSHRFDPERVKLFTDAEGTDVYANLGELYDLPHIIFPVILCNFNPHYKYFM